MAEHATSINSQLETSRSIFSRFAKAIGIAMRTALLIAMTLLVLAGLLILPGLRASASQIFADALWCAMMPGMA